MQITLHPCSSNARIPQSMFCASQSIFSTLFFLNGIILRHKCVRVLYQHAVIPLPRHMLTTFACLLRRAAS